jgi:hypothetical protein
VTLLLWVVIGLTAALAATLPVSPGAFQRRSSKERSPNRAAQRWTETEKRDEYRRATWRRHMLNEVGRYDDDPLTVLACRRPAPQTPEDEGHRDAMDACRRTGRIR